MAQAPRDQNHVPTALAVKDTDGSTVTPINVDPDSHVLLIIDGVGGSDLTGDDALRDQNRVSCLMAVSSDDGITPVPLYIDSAGRLLVQNT